ncbi:hypothetical protein A0U91_14780 (plasmid) [Acetobacter persici]|uniref:Nucleotidyl transferase domain-containing protein n=2 Tax=Acetobacter persici TaxID=1076596 RepID=A0A1U9LIV4_9PROT|nr:hypothetical protein A0U91_14780 [Acetobacter persici]
MGLSVLILAVGSDVKGRGGLDGYPFLAAEMSGMVLMERIIRQCEALSPETITCMLGADDIDEYHLDSIVKLSSPGVSIIRVEAPTAGAACTGLLASDVIDNERELLIVNANNFVESGFRRSIDFFRSWRLPPSEGDLQANGGIITFDSIHPRYSSVRVSGDRSDCHEAYKHFVEEVSEKNPISRNASVGVYWFRRGVDYIDACKEMIRKDVRVDGQFFVSMAYNEIILENGIVVSHKIDRDSYFPIKTPREVLALQNHFAHRAARGGYAGR